MNEIKNHTGMYGFVEGRNNPIKVLLDNYTCKSAVERISCLPFDAEVMRAKIEETQAQKVVDDLLFYEHMKRVLHYIYATYTSYTNDAKMRPGIEKEQLFCDSCMEVAVRSIVHLVPVEYIYCIKGNGDYCSLIIILSSDCRYAITALKEILDLELFQLLKIEIIIQNYGAVTDLIKRGDLYYNVNCHEANLVYSKSGKPLLPLIPKQQFQSSIADVVKRIQLNLQKARSFYKGGLMYCTEQENVLAMFMFHQSCEITLRALIFYIGSKEIKSHSLALLHQHIWKYVPQVKHIFAQCHKVQERMFDDLENVYLKARYDTRYEVATKKVEVYKQKLFYFLNGVEVLFQNSFASISINYPSDFRY